jgi:DNA-binding IclR family transcriptional regulator
LRIGVRYENVSAHIVLKTVNRAGLVLGLFTAERPEWGVTGVAQSLGIAKSQAHELLTSLVEIGLLQRVDPGRYRLGWRISTLYELYEHSSGLRADAAQVMRGLAGRYGESVQLAVWGSGRAVCIAACPGTLEPAAPPLPVGADVPGHGTGAGKVLMASRPWDEVHDVMQRRGGLARMTERTITTGDDLYDELHLVRRRGVAFEDEEHAPEVCGVGAPVRDARGDVVAAVSLSVQRDRWRAGAHAYTRVVIAAARRLGRLAEPVAA